MTTACNAPGQSVDITPAVSPPEPRTLTGEVPGPVIVVAGETVKITGARVAGAVSVEPGGILEVTDSALQAGVVAEIPASLRLCSSQIRRRPAARPWLCRGQWARSRWASRPPDAARTASAVTCGWTRCPTWPWPPTSWSAASQSRATGPAGSWFPAMSSTGPWPARPTDPAPTNGGTPNRASSKSGQCTTV